MPFKAPRTVPAFRIKHNMGNCTICKTPLRPEQLVKALRLTGQVNSTAYAHANKAECK